MQRSLLRRRRFEQGLQIQQVAQAINIDSSHLGKIEQGRANPSLKSGIKIARFYGLDVDELEQLFKKDDEK